MCGLQTSYNEGDACTIPPALSAEVPQRPRFTFWQNVNLREECGASCVRRGTAYFVPATLEVD